MARVVGAGPLVSGRAAGADLIGVGDAAASLVGPKIYDEFVWPYEKKMVDAMHAMGTRVRLHICGNTSRILGGMGRLGCEIVDLDFKVSLAQARQAMGPQQVLLGNLDPVAALRNGTPASIAAAIAECHRQAGPRYIVAAGCEVPRDTPQENLLRFAITPAHARPCRKDPRRKRVDQVSSVGNAFCGVPGGESTSVSLPGTARRPFPTG